jgi:predicted regulator of Ras-like GTPase activity (Roadblock/LC7/MglB family)
LPLARGCTTAFMAGDSVLTSLFGDLGSLKHPDASKRRTDEEPDQGFAATAIMESVATEVNARGQMVDRHSHDLVVTGSPAQAIREHFANTRADLDTASSLITLLDPAGVWASAVIKALSDAGGRPIERLHLREHTTLRTLATIERTTLVRRHEDTLRIYHADVRAAGSDNAEIPVALMERSQMTTVIIGPLQPHAIDALLQALHAAAMLPTWRCPNLLFMLPPNAVWIANKVSAIAWPGRLHVHVISESMTGASSVWNAMLGMWNHVKAQPGWEPTTNPPLMGMGDFPIKVRDLGEPVVGAMAAANTVAATASGLFTTPSLAAAPRVTPAAPSVMRISRNVLDPVAAQAALAGVVSIEGLLGCAVVDSTTGLVLARESRADHAIDMDLVAAACAQVMRAHRLAARSMGLADQVDEVMTSAGARQQVMRTVSRHPDLFLVVQLDKHRTNLALARFQLMEVERGLA